MMNRLSPEKRSKIMASIRSKDTKPEISVRKKLHKMGFRFRLYKKDLPGKPDIVLPRYKIAIWVQGCFWHAHTCKAGERPRTRIDYWEPKIAKNIERDKKNQKIMKELGWANFIIWECEVNDERKFSRKLSQLQKKTKKYTS